MKKMSKSEPKIKNISSLRDHALETIERLASGEIDTAHAAATGKLCDSVISTIKSQLEYSRMTGESPEIPFMMTPNKGNLLEHEEPKPRLSFMDKRK